MHKKIPTNITKYNVKIKSKIHPSIYHTVRVDLRCYERMPDEKTLYKHAEKIFSNRKIE